MKVVMKILFIFNCWYLIIASIIHKIKGVNIILFNWDAAITYIIFTLLININSQYIIGIMIVQLTMIISFLIMSYNDKGNTSGIIIYWTFLESLPFIIFVICLLAQIGIINLSIRQLCII